MIKRLILAIAVCIFASPAYAAFDSGDLICETTTTTGTGTLSLGGALGNFLTFVSQITSGDTVTYTIQASDGKIETGTGVFTDGSPDTLTRVAAWSTDGNGSELNLPAGTHTVCNQFNNDYFGDGISTPNVDSLTVTTEAYDATDWDDDNTVPTKDAVRDKIEGHFFNVQILDSGTGATYTPTTGSTFFKVICTGAGGGGGGSDTDGSGAGGGGGAQAGGTGISWFDATEMGANAVYTIGAGGAGGSATNGTDGTVGGDTTFNPAGSGTTITAQGGDFGSGTTVAGDDDGFGSAGAITGGTPTGADLNLYGSEGTPGWALHEGTGVGPTAISGQGGESFWGGRQRFRVSQSTNDFVGAAAVAYGAGGMGGLSVDSTTGAAGGAGMSGICVVEEYGQ